MKPVSKQSYLALPLITMICILLVSIPGASANSVGFVHPNNASPSSFENHTGKAEEVFNFPEDHVLHQPQAIVKNTELFAEWLYWTGVLKDIKTDDLYGVQYTLFQMNIQPGLIGYANHVAISDVHNSEHPFYGYSTLPDQGNVSKGIDHNAGAFWRYKDNQTTLTYWMDLDAWNIVTQGIASKESGHEQNISLNLTIVNDNADYYLQTPTGINEQGICLGIGSEDMAGRSYYYSHPSMNTTGTLTIDGRKINVIGHSWFDHQWGGFGKCYPAWDWFSLRLDNGSFVMLYNLKGPFMNDIPDQRGLTYVDPKGNITWWHGENAANMTATRWWKSESWGVKYPLEWIIETPVGRFALEPYFDQQSMDIPGSPIKYWEGIMRVRSPDHRGRQIGMGYLEITGYAPIK
jgi:predicted secreted hydrolase